MPDLAIVYRPAASLAPAARNARTHSPEQIQQIAASMQAVGWTNPILIDEAGGIIAGHGRLAAGGLLGIDPVPTICIPGLTAVQRKALMLADNRLAENAGWDSALLAAELTDLAEWGFDATLIGFTADELAELTGPPADEPPPRASLADRFMVAPFSVMNAREGWWQARKAAWLALGIRSELGRGGTAATPPHPPTVTQNADGTLNYDGGTAGQAERFDAQRSPPAKKGRFAIDAPQSADLRGDAQALRTSTDPYRAKAKKDRASPGGSPRPAADYSKSGNGTGRAL